MIDYNLIIFVGETGNAGCFKLLIDGCLDIGDL